MATLSWQDIVAKKQAEREEKIPSKWKIDKSQYTERRNVLDVPSTCGILTQKELEITSNYDAVDLIAKLKNGTFSAEEVTLAFCKRAAIAQQLTNCLTEIMFDEAIARAKTLDRERAANPDKQLPKLWGLPISLKDMIMVIGVDASIGLCSLANQPSPINSSVVDLLKAQGAIFHCKTNVPQTLMTADSDNNMFGRTLNPLNRNLTVGGSSGGEGALVAMRGSLIGMGTDIGGSIRIPSHCNGIYGFKPSSWIVPLVPMRVPATPGTPGIPGVIGPLATSARSNAMLMRCIMEAEPWKYDVGCHHIPWRNLSLPTRSLRIGFVEDDGAMNTPTPPIRRGLRETFEKLTRAGIEVVPVELTNVKEDIGLVFTSWTVDGFKHMTNLIDSTGEPLVPSVQKIGLVAMPFKTMEEYFQFNVGWYATKARYKQMWLDNNLDALICPVAPFTAPPIDGWGGSVQYTALWNLLEYPATVIPIGKVNAEDVVDNAAKYGPEDEATYKMYTGPDDYADAPITIQVVGMKEEDEFLALVTAKLDEVLNGSR